MLFCCLYFIGPSSSASRTLKYHLNGILMSKINNRTSPKSRSWIIASLVLSDTFWILEESCHINWGCLNVPENELPENVTPFKPVLKPGPMINTLNALSLVLNASIINRLKKDEYSSSSVAFPPLLILWLFLDWTVERRWERNFIYFDVSLFHGKPWPIAIISVT